MKIWNEIWDYVKMIIIVVVVVLVINNVVLINAKILQNPWKIPS